MRRRRAISIKMLEYIHSHRYTGRLTDDQLCVFPADLLELLVDGVTVVGEQSDLVLELAVLQGVVERLEGVLELLLPIGLGDTGIIWVAHQLVS